MLIDSHCHLNYKGLREDIQGVVERARERGIGCFLSINTKLSEYHEIVGLIDTYPDVFGTVGIHPHEAEGEPDVAVEALVERSKHPKIVGLGETGLDYYYDNAPRDMQQVNFRAHIAAARITGLPVIVHTRDADEDCERIMREELAIGPYKAVIHCFTAGEALAKAVLDMGFYISLSGIVTFKNAKDLQAIAVTIPSDRLLVETDAPFLAPVPNRGKVCEPAFVRDTAEFVANLRGQSYEDLCKTTSANFMTLFDKVDLQEPGAISA